MSGVKGKSGGVRPGAGAKKKERLPVLPKIGIKDPLAFLLAVMQDPSEDSALRVRAAVAAAQYTNTRTHDGGKKESREKAANAVIKGKFAPAAPPKLVVNNT